MFNKLFRSLILVSAVLLNTSVSHTQTLAPIHFHVQDAQAQPIDHAGIHSESPNGAWNAVTDAAGDFTANLSPGHYDVTFSASGFKNRLIPADLKDPGTITIGLDALASAFNIQGRDFVDVTGTRFVFNGTDQFPAYRMFLDGKDLSPLVQESHELGFNLWRVFMQGSIAQNGILQLSPDEAGYYEQVRPFANYLNSKGITLLATIYVDNQDIHAPYSHWIHMADLLRGSGVLLSGGNEYAKNGFDPGQLANLGSGILWSRGSNLGDAAPPQPYALFAEFHPRRDLPKSFDDGVASATFLYSGGLNVPLIIDEPLGYADTDQPGRRSNSPRVAWTFGRLYSTMTSGAVFHNDYGMKGQLMSPTVRALAQAWTKGMQL